MVGKRSIPLLMFLAMLTSVLVGTSAAQSVENAAEVPAASSDRFEKVLLEGDIGEPMTMDITSDGRIFMTDRSGTVRVHDQATGETVVAAEIETYTDPYPDGSNEGGLLGIALDPEFDQNHWIYLYYSHPEESHVQLSRFDVHGNHIDLSSEIVMLEVESQRQDCCHLGGDLTFDPDGNLYLSVGDETNPFQSNGFAPIDERPGREVFDAQGTAGNTNDLRGKILRITPQPDGSYTIPEGNLFPVDEYDGDLTRPEIYVMGARNPFRMEIDPVTGWLYYGMYGPGSSSWNDERGPMGLDQWHEVREAGNFGWPFCTGDRYPYRPWDFDTNSPAGDWFDCENGPANNSPNNTGLTDLPPVQPATIYYPINWNNYPFDPPEPFLALGSGAGGPNSGPIYRYDPDLESDTKFPEQFDGAWFLLEWHRNYIKTAQLDDGVVVSIDDFMDDTEFLHPHDAMFGPDGSLYLLEYGSGWFGPADDNGLYRIDYVGDREPPECVAEFVDEFEGDELDRDAWPTIVRENPDGYRVENGDLVIETAVGDMIRDITTAENLIMQPLPADGAWQVTTEMTLDPTDPWQQGGLIVHGDDQNFIKAPLAYSGSGQRRVEFILHVDGEARATSADWADIPADFPSTFQLRLIGDASQVRAQYSADGEEWTSFGRAATLSGMDDPQVGFFAARGPDEGPVVDASYHSFTRESCEEPPPEPCPDTEQPPAGWEALYDGESLEGWSQAGPGGFEIDDCGLLQAYGGMGLLWYEEQSFSDYVLRVDWRTQHIADNSGVFLRFPDPQGDPWNPVNEGYEIQIYDVEENPLYRTGAIYTFGPAEEFASNPPGEWNTFEIYVTGQEYRVVLNDVEVATYTGDGSRGLDGYVGLQNHAGDAAPGENVAFRNVWIKELDDEPGTPAVEAILDPAEPDGDNGWYVSPVTLTLESDDPDATLQYRTAGDDEWSTWTEPVMITDDGTYDIEYRAVGDHEPEEHTVVVGPDGSWTYDPDEFTVRQGDTIKYVLDSGFHNVVTTDHEGSEVATSGPPSAGWEDDPYYYTAEDAGLFYIYCTPHAGTSDPDPENWTGMVAKFNVLPVADGSEIGEVSFSIDQTAPVTEATLDGDQDGDAYTGPVTVTLDADDATSGVAETTYRMADAESEVYDEPFTIDTQGDHTVEFRSADNAGNVEEWQSVEFTIVDSEPGACPDPDPRATVVLRGVDSGVTNYALDDGCTINDLIRDDDDWPNHGAFLGHVRDVTDSLVTDGVITKQERSAIVRSAARSNAGGRGGST